MRKSIFALTTALALASPSLSLEARAGNPFLDYQQKMSQTATSSKSKNSFADYQEKTSQKSSVKYESPKKQENPVQVQGTLVDLTKRTSDRYIKYAILEEKAEQIPTPVPEPPVAQEYPTTQYASQQPMPGACKPVQKIVQAPAPTPMLIQGAPEVKTQPQTVYSSQLIINGGPITQPQAESVAPKYYCRNLPFGGLFRWLFAGPRCNYAGTPYYSNYSNPLVGTGFGGFAQGFGGFPGFVGRPGYGRVPPVMGMGFSPMMGFPGMGMQPFMRPGIGMPFGPGFGPGFVPGSFMGGRPSMPYQNYRHF